jgi:H+-translocating NAD(P) transhydrogenase subunit alpha
MNIGVLKELAPETRVSLSPDAVTVLVKKGHKVCIEKDAGALSFNSDEQYIAAGACICERNEVIQKNNVLLTIHAPSELPSIGTGKIFIGIYAPLMQTELVNHFAQSGSTVFSLDMLPRTTRAQAMDVLSSQANIAGYKAVLTAAMYFPRYFPMFMTAAGSVPPAKMLILGAGVAGLQAIATAKRLGAVVEVFDTRPSVKEEVMSLGAKFVEVEGAADASSAGGYAVEQTEEYKQKQQDRIAEAVKKADAIVTTAQIPGKKAPILINEAMVASMRLGSVIIDLAAATGGNTPYTLNNQTVQINGVTIIGNSNLAATVPSDASRLYAKNVTNFIALIADKEGNLNLNFEDDLVKGSCITHENAIVHERLKP